MLTWKQVECWRATTADGRVYEVVESWVPGKRYAAVIRFTDSKGRDFSHVLGFCDVAGVAMKMCEDDAKDSTDTTRTTSRGDFKANY